MEGRKWAMAIGIANTILNVNIVLGCISFALNVYVLAVLIIRERKYRKASGNHEGSHVRAKE